jgi:outer membrane protein
VSFSPGGTLERVAGLDLDPAHEVLVQGIRAIGDRNAFAAQGRYGATLDISKTLYDFGRTALAVEAARAEQAAASADDQATRRQVLDEVRAAYLAWLSATEVAAISDQAVADAAAHHKRVVDLVAEGVKPAADISPVASDEALARLEASRSRAEVENARIMLDAAIGGGLPADAEPDRRAMQIDLPPSGTTGENAESSADAAVHALERQRDAARATAGMSGVFPMYRVGVSVSVTLWDGGSASANANVARAQAEELAARSRELSQARQAARRQAEADAAAAQERLRIARELLALSDRRAREAEDRYEQARGPIEAIAEASAMRRRANMEIVLGEIATARARYALQDR